MINKNIIKISFIFLYLFKYEFKEIKFYLYTIYTNFVYFNSYSQNKVRFCFQRDFMEINVIPLILLISEHQKFIVVV